MTVAPAGPIPKCPVTLAMKGSACLSRGRRHLSFLVPCEQMRYRPVGTKYIGKSESRGRGKAGNPPPRSYAKEAIDLFPVDMRAYHDAYKPFGVPVRTPHGHLWVGTKLPGPVLGFLESISHWVISDSGPPVHQSLQAFVYWSGEGYPQSLAVSFQDQATCVCRTAGSVDITETIVFTAQTWRVITAFGLRP